MRRIGLTLFLIGLCIPAVAQEDRPLQRIAFGSCHKLDRPFDIWDVMLARKPELFIFMGDTIYADTVDMEVKRRHYAQLAAVESFARFRKNTPFIATWDDHDYGANDGGSDYPAREQAKRVFLDFFQEPDDSPRWKHPGVYHSYLYGPEGKRVQVILLDTRWFRSPLKLGLQKGGYLPLDDPKATLLGEAQWKWLAEELKRPAEIRLIASSIQVIHEDHPFEKWANLPLERKRLFDLIAAAGASGTILLSGDRHHGEINALDGPAGYRLYDVTSSGLNTVYAEQDEPSRHRIGEILWRENFGMVHIDWEAADPRITLEVCDEKGKPGPQVIVPLSKLRAAAKPPGEHPAPAR